MSKRDAEKMEAVDVEGFGRRWRFASGMPLQEAMAFISRQMSLNVETLAMEVVDEEPPVVLPRDFTLVTGHKYRVSPLIVQACSPSPRIHLRQFGAGLAIFPDVHYYVQPSVDVLVQKLNEGKYCVLCGSRQSGKTTSVLAAKARLSTARPAYLGFGLSGANGSWENEKLWGCLWDGLNVARPDLFRARNVGEECDGMQFTRLFVKESLLSPVIILLDEADSILDLSPACIDEFFHVIRGLKADRERFNLFGFLLIGTERVRDLLEAQYDKGLDDAARCNREYQPSSTPSRLSPFPHDLVLASTKFSLEDVVSLLKQAADDRPGVHIDVDEIAASIMQWTWGHKGLTGTCLAYLVQEELWTFKAWVNRAESYRLGNYIFDMSTYSRTLKFVRMHADKDPFHDVMVKVLGVEELLCEKEMVLKFRDFIAEGVLIATEHETGDYAVSISSPLLRTAILRGCEVVYAEVDAPPNPYRLDRWWVILQVVKNLDGYTMCRPEALNSFGEPSEYAYQFEFICSLKAILRQTYPSMGAKVLPEAKQIPVRGRQGSQLRLDILVRDGYRFSKFGFELVASGSERAILEHMERAVKYHKLHSAKVFVMNFFLNNEQEHILLPDHEAIVFVSVCFNVSENLAVVKFVDIDGQRQRFDVPLKKWSRQFIFCTNVTSLHLSGDNNRVHKI